MTGRSRSSGGTISAGRETLVAAATVLRDRIQFLIYGAILAFLLYLLAETLTLPELPRRVPLIIVLPAILLTGIQLVILAFPDRFATTGGDGVADFEALEEIEDEVAAQTERDPWGPIKAVAWFTALPFLVYLVGFVLGTFVFVTAFTNRVVELTPARSTITGVLLAAFIYVVFIYGINVRAIEPVLLPAAP